MVNRWRDDRVKRKVEGHLYVCVGQLFHGLSRAPLARREIESQTDRETEKERKRKRDSIEALRKCSIT